MNTGYADSNEYEVEMNSKQESIDPHNRVGGVLDDRQLEDSEFEVDEEFSCANTQFGEFDEDKL